MSRLLELLRDPVWQGIAGIIAICVAALGFIKFAKSKNPIANAIKPKPRLVITVRDIACHVTREIYETERWKGPRIVWWVECMVEIRNKSRVTATQVVGVMTLNLERGDNILSRESKKTTKTYRLARSDVRRERIVFEPEYIDPFFKQDHLDLYPDASYRLDYICSCRERAGTRKATAKGELSKADWVGEGQDLLAIRTAGFKVPG